MKYCRLCLQTDTRPGIRFDEGGTCPACVYAASLQDADWDARQKELQVDRPLAAATTTRATTASSG